MQFHPKTGLEELLELEEINSDQISLQIIFENLQLNESLYSVLKLYGILFFLVCAGSLSMQMSLDVPSHFFLYFLLPSLDVRIFTNTSIFTFSFMIWYVLPFNYFLFAFAHNHF